MTENFLGALGLNGPHGPAQTIRTFIWFLSRRLSSQADSRGATATNMHTGWDVSLLVIVVAGFYFSRIIVAVIASDLLFTLSSLPGP